MGELFMEQPLYRNDLDPNNPFSGDSGSFAKNQENVRHAAGQIVLHETPHAGEIALTEADKTLNTQRGAAFRPVHLPKAAGFELATDMPPVQETSATNMSAWHNTALNPAEYGQAFHNERNKEQKDDPAPDTTPVAAMAASANPLLNSQVPQPTVSQPQPTPTPSLTQASLPDANTHYVAPPSNTPVNPLFNVMPNPAEPTTTAQVVQPLQQNPNFVTPPASSVVMAGAINPSQPIAPMEPRLPMGQPAPIDAQHRLPAPRSILKRALQNPVVWLAIGISMVIYFGRSLF